MQIIHQQLEVKEFPVREVGDKKFMGYIVGIGFHYGDWGNKEMFVYADFAYNSDYVRYRIPNDVEFLKQLNDWLLYNTQCVIEEFGVYGKLHIARTEKGYTMELP